MADFSSFISPTPDNRQTITQAGANSASISLLPGSYGMSQVRVIGEVGIQGLGATFPGATPQAIADLSVVNSAAFWQARSISSGYARYTSAYQLVAFPSGNHTRSYESAALLGSVVIQDNSTYSAEGGAVAAGVCTSARDYLALDANGYVPVGTTRARFSLGNSYMKVGEAGKEGQADGSGGAWEFRIDNHGTETPYFQTSTTKTVVSVFSGGTRRSTALLYAGRGDSAGAYYGVAIDPDACSDYVFASVRRDGVEPQNALWGVLPSGAMEFKGYPGPAAPGAGRVRIFYNGGDMVALFPDGTSKMFVMK